MGAAYSVLKEKDWMAGRLKQTFHSKPFIPDSTSLGVNLPVPRSLHRHQWLRGVVERALHAPRARTQDDRYHSGIKYGYFIRS